MNADTSSQNPFPTSPDAGSSAGDLDGDANRVHRFAQSVHQAVDQLEQSIGTTSEKVMNMQQQYGDMAREQVRSNPIAALGIAFAAGFVFAKIFGR